MQHAASIVAGFTAQAESFNTSAVAADGDMLDRITAWAQPGRDECWLEAACGPGLIARRLAPEVAAVTGFDLTPAMIAVAKREAATAGLDNATFTIGDATALPVADGFFDCAVSRFSLHHIPVPERLITEMARVVKPGGKLVLVDPLADEEPQAAAWSQEVERLRDPSHWASLSLSQLHAMIAGSAWRLEREEVMALELDFDDWLARGQAAPAQQELAERLVSEPPAGATCFQVRTLGGRRILRLALWLARLRRGDAA